MNCSKTIETLESDFISTLLPVIKAPISYKAGISIGKLKGHIMDTGP